MSDIGIRNLAAAINLQAVRDYLAGTPEQKRVILKDLRSTRMDFITRGQSVMVAEQLELRPDEIAENLRRCNTDMV